MKKNNIPCERCILLAICKNIKTYLYKDHARALYSILNCEILFNFYDNLPREGKERNTIFEEIKKLLS